MTGTDPVWKIIWIYFHILIISWFELTSWKFQNHCVERSLGPPPRLGSFRGDRIEVEYITWGEKETRQKDNPYIGLLPGLPDMDFTGTTHQYKDSVRAGTPGKIRRRAWILRIRYGSGENQPGRKCKVVESTVVSDRWVGWSRWRPSTEMQISLWRRHLDQWARSIRDWSQGKHMTSKERRVPYWGWGEREGGGGEGIRDLILGRRCTQHYTCNALSGHSLSLLLGGVPVNPRC